MDSTAAGGCPRCRARLRRNYKYCPNCSYRLRPEIVPTTATPSTTVPLASRLVALGGYLAFASMLLLVVFAGFRLFDRPESDPESEPRVILTRDADRLGVGPESFLAVEAGEALYGPYEEKDAEEAVVPTRFLVDDPFRLGLHEITNDQYYEFLLARAKRSGRVDKLLFPEGWARRSGNPEVRWIYDRGDGNLPVMGVHYQFALEFCAWYWEERLGAERDVIVDLPTSLEYVRAARGDRIQYNFPWGATFDRRYAILDGDPRPVNSPRVGLFTLDGKPVEVDSSDVGFFALVGNAAEWVHGHFTAERVPLAAGWSHLNAEYTLQDRRLYSPFGDDGFLPMSEGKPRRDVGFRILLRHAPALPEFVKVSAGEAAHVPRSGERLRPPPITDEDGNFVAEADPITFGTPSVTVARPFEMTRAEITNRQYLYFLASVSDSRPTAEMAQLIPNAWERPNPWNWRKADADVTAWEDTVYLGPWKSPWKIPHVYEAGEDNRPVEGVTLAQVGAYTAWLSARFSKTCRIPTVAEFLRAGRGEGRAPYPWGDDAGNPLLVCTRGIDDEEKAVSLLGRLGASAPPFVGLAGNLPEYVRDTRGGRVLLAGGCYRFPPALCTLDSFLDAAWEYVEFDVQGGEDEETVADVLKPLSFYAGFRLVRELGPF